MQDPSPITLPPPGRMKAVSMTAMRCNKTERLAAHADALRHRDALPRLVRLADSLILGAALEAATASLEAVRLLFYCVCCEMLDALPRKLFSTW